MMRITFLGHQGWHFENEGRGLMLDPILESIGNGRAKLPIWPARRLDFGKFGPIEAVIVSHEHADHFSLETLAALPKPCRIYLSDLSSSAMECVISEMGFEVRRFGALQPFTVCGLRITALPGLYNLLEPDAYALLFENASGASFLTSIDTIPHPDVFKWLSAHCPARTLDNLTNNFIEPRHALVKDPTSFSKSKQIVAANAVEFADSFKPRRAVISGQGWCFGKSKSALNHSYFSANNRWLARSLLELAPKVEWFEGVPGMRCSLSGGECSLDQAPLVGALDYPDRSFDPSVVEVAEPYPPWSEITEIPVDRMNRLRTFVTTELGATVSAHAPKLMERLYYLKMQSAGMKEISATIALVLRNGSMRAVFEFDYGRLRFEEIVSGGECAAGVEMWASDLELIVDAEEEAFSIYESAIKPWSFVGDLIPESALNELFIGFTPRFRPREYLAAYRRALVSQGGRVE